MTGVARRASRMEDRVLQDNFRAGPVVVQLDGRDEEDPAQQIGTEFPLQELSQHVKEQRPAADDEDREQWNLRAAGRGAEAEAKDEIDRDAGDRQRRAERWSGGARGRALRSAGGRAQRSWHRSRERLTLLRVDERVDRRMVTAVRAVRGFPTGCEKLT